MFNFNKNLYLKKIIFFCAIISVGFLSRIAYNAQNNSQTFSTNKSLALVNPNSIISVSNNSQPMISDNVQNSGFSTDKNFAAEDTIIKSDPLLSQNNNNSVISGLKYQEVLIANLDNGAIFFSSNDSKKWPLASLSKLMTATIVLDNFQMDQKITITHNAFIVDPEERTLREGNIYSVSDLLHFLLLPSSNVAAEAFADAFGRSKFLAAMNARALSWGMMNTHYDDPSGLSSGNQSTADDLLLLAKKIYFNYPQILTITRTPQIYTTELGSSTKVLVKSINYFAGQSDFIGGKTGYTNIADGNLLSIFRYKSNPIIVIILGTSEADRFTNTQKLFDWFKSQPQ
jgi:D-alanyl-D-alanine carboxypeptidase